MSGTEQFDFAGFTDDNGFLGRPVPSGLVVVPTEVWREENSIRWRMDDRARLQVVSRDLLNQFIRLSEPESVLTFAKNWGVLALGGDEILLPGRDWKSEGAEPIAAWLYYARRAKAVLNVAAALKQKKLGDLADWGEFAALYLEPGKKSFVMGLVEQNIDKHRFGLGYSIVSGFGGVEVRLKNASRFVASEITGWLDCWKKERTGGVSDLTPQWNDDERRWDLQIDYHGLLFPAIALQLALVVADADSLYSCSGCGVPYIRSRGRKRPKAGWANYCTVCSDCGVAQRRAVENYREKRSTAVRLHSSGKSSKEIADELGTSVTKVARWLKTGESNAKTKTRK